MKALEHLMHGYAGRSTFKHGEAHANIVVQAGAHACMVVQTEAGGQQATGRWQAHPPTVLIRQ